MWSEGSIPSGWSNVDWLRWMVGERTQFISYQRFRENHCQIMMEIGCIYSANLCILNVISCNCQSMVPAHLKKKKVLGNYPVL